MLLNACAFNVLWLKIRLFLGWRTSEEQGPLNQVNEAHMNPQKMKQQGQSLQGSIPGPLHVYYSFQFSNLWDSWVCESVGF